jgi:hypothetical protein
MPNRFNICEVAYYVFNVCAITNDAERSAASRRDAGARQYCKRVVAREAAVVALGGGVGGALAVMPRAADGGGLCSQHQAMMRGLFLPREYTWPLSPKWAAATRREALARGAGYSAANGGGGVAAGERSYPVAKQRGCAIVGGFVAAAAAKLITCHKRPITNSCCCKQCQALPSRCICVTEGLAFNVEYDISLMQFFFG